MFDEIYSEIYRFSEAEQWMNDAKKIIFIGTSFSVNITSIALKIAITKNTPVEIVDPNPIKINYDNVIYFEMTGDDYCKKRNSL